MAYKTITLVVGSILYKSAMYIEKQTMIVVQAAPKTHPGGVQGALLRFKYQSDCGPLSISQLPMASEPKLRIKKMTIYLKVFIKMFKSSLNFKRYNTTIHWEYLT